MTGKGLSWCAYFPNGAQGMMTLEDIRERDAELCAEIERLTEVQMRLSAEAREQIQAKDAEIERLTNAIRRIDGINDNPADYNPAINAVCDAILRPHLEPKP